MTCKLEHALLFASLLCLSNGTMAAPTQSTTPFESLVVATYAHYSWEAVLADGPESDILVPLRFASLSSLRKVFVDDLALAIRKDAECARIERGICLLDFHILFDSQDPVARELTVHPQSELRASVCFVRRKKLSAVCRYRALSVASR